MNKRRLLFRVGAVVILLAIAACMMVIGRGHTVYVDNKTLEYNGETYKTPYRVNVYVNGDRIAKLANRERGMTTNIGQSFKMTLGVIQEKGNDEQMIDVSLKLPYNMDGIIFNVPGYLAELPQDAWMSEFIAAPTEAEMQDEELPGEEEDILAGAEF
jgi:hypothetical protein